MKESLTRHQVAREIFWLVGTAVEDKEIRGSKSKSAQFSLGLLECLTLHEFPQFVLISCFRYPKFVCESSLQITLKLYSKILHVNLSNEAKSAMIVGQKINWQKYANQVS